MDSIVREICDDIADRHGLGNVFDALNPEDLDSMREELAAALRLDYSVESIIEYLESHSGWEDEWQQIDEDIQDDIVDDWQDILDAYQE